MAVVMVNIIPLGTKTGSVSEYIASAIKVLQKEKIKYEITSMGTILEGELDNILSITRKMHEAVLTGEITRVVTTIRIDDRRDETSTISTKMQSLRDKLAI
jgi:uncharacterized protein (TIGR00106 family)